MDEDLDIPAGGEEDSDDDSLLLPVNLWGGSPKAVCNMLQPGIKLGSNRAIDVEDVDDSEPLINRSKTGKIPNKGKRKVRPCRSCK
jgi:hypothetical protein